MPFPWGGDEDGVELFLFEEVLPGVGVAGVDLGLFLTEFCEDAFCMVEHVVVDVADGDDVDVVAAKEEGDVGLAAEAGAEDGEADFGAGEVEGCCFW